ncbi:MAG: histidine phosphatase family protein [Verrucomicrobiota bacterium]
MTTVFLIRHGETEWNQQGIHQGHMDSPLTPHGENQARQLGERFQAIGRPFDAIYSSDLGRAKQTVEAICRPIGQSGAIQWEPRLRERALGILEGLTYPQIEEKMPEDYRQHTSGDPDYCPEGGESWRDLYGRATSTLEDLATSHDGERILCVTHGGVVSMAMRHCMGIDLAIPRRFHIANTALNILECEDRTWRLRTWGDTAHLEGETTLDEML